MWQVDNDKYCLWRLEHELNVKRMDREIAMIRAEFARTGITEAGALLVTIAR
jgi:hypothetical protein